MAGRHSFAKLRAGMSPEQQKQVETASGQLEAEMDLAEVRRAMKLSQDELAQVLQVGQASVAKMEKRADMYVSTLRRFIEAMGGELEITARFNNHSVRIRSFGDFSGRP